MYSLAEELLALTDGGGVNAPRHGRVAVIVFAAFAVEGFLNHLGDEHGPFWKKKQRLSPRRKLLSLAERRELQVDWTKEPWLSFTEAFETRNMLAHPRTEELRRQYETEGSVVSPLLVDGELERRSQASERILQQTRVVISALWKAYGHKDDALFCAGLVESISLSSRKGP